MRQRGSCHIECRLGSKSLHVQAVPGPTAPLEQMTANACSASLPPYLTPDPIPSCRVGQFRHSASTTNAAELLIVRGYCQARRHITQRSESPASRTLLRSGCFSDTSPLGVKSAPARPFRKPQVVLRPDRNQLAFRAFTDVWKARRGCELANASDNAYRLGTICRFALPGTEVDMLFGDKALDSITTDDIEAFRDARKTKGLSPVAVNHDLRLLRKMFNWAIRKGYLDRTPFKIGTEPAIRLEREFPRRKRLQTADDEKRLLDSSGPQLRAFIIAMLDTGCRPGEILSLQWRDVSLDRNELIVRAEKEKTRTGRIIPITSRLKSILEMRRLDPEGEEFGPEAYAFGNEVEERVKPMRELWTEAVEKAGLTGLQMRDLRHEAGSRFMEAGMPISYVSNMLGHTNLTTTSRYLNINVRVLHREMEKFETARRLAESVASLLQENAKSAQTNLPQADANSAEPSSKPTVQ